MVFCVVGSAGTDGSGEGTGVDVGVGEGTGVWVGVDVGARERTGVAVGTGEICEANGLGLDSDERDGIRGKEKDGSWVCGSSVCLPAVVVWAGGSDKTVVVDRQPDKPNAKARINRAMR